MGRLDRNALRAISNGRFESVLNFNIHVHNLFLYGVYIIDGEQVMFRGLPAPRPQALEGLIQTIAYRIAVGPQAGCKTFTLKTVAARASNAQERPP